MLLEYPDPEQLSMKNGGNDDENDKRNQSFGELQKFWRIAIKTRRLKKITNGKLLKQHRISP